MEERRSSRVDDVATGRWVHADDLAQTCGADRSSVLDLGQIKRGMSPSPYVLEGSGHTIWSILRAPHQVSEVVRVVAGETGLDGSDLEDTVVSFIEELHHLGLLSRLP